jgi:glycosyltransferase involved in cell wall biosynthesis
MEAPLVLVSNHVKPVEDYHWEQANDLTPRVDYYEVAERIRGAIHGYGLPNGVFSQKISQVQNKLKLDLTEALFVARRASDHNLFLSSSEKAAIPLAFFMALKRLKKPHVLIGHHLSSKNKARLFKLWGLQSTFAHIVCVSRAQADYAVQQLGFQRSKVDFVYDKVDHKFYRPDNELSGNYILSVGQEQRDYSTLLEAVRETRIKLVVVASSPWSTFQADTKVLEDVTVFSHIPYRRLRDLYARARLVVVPLFNADYAAGANTVLEAMSMAKPVVVSQTTGICDYLVSGETGLFVPPGEPAALREAILSIWDHPTELKRLGANARQAVQQSMNLDLYVERVAQIVYSMIPRI